MKALFFLFLFCICFSLNAHARQKVLVLHAYHPGYKWTDDIQKGIYSVIDTKEYELYIEYMDTKHFSSYKHYENLLALYKEKYKNITFDVVISSDDNAFNFLKKYHYELFVGTAKIFCGVNFFTPSQLEGLKGFSGINEDADVLQNLRLIERIHPDLEKLYILADKTTTGQKVRERVFHLLEKESFSFNIELLEDEPLQKLLSTLKREEENVAVLLTVFFKDNKGEFYEYHEASSLLHEQLAFPIYALWDFNLENGALGGFLTSGYFQGKTAALMAQKVLNGVRIENIPMALKSPNEYMFDYALLDMYDIDKERLPKQSYFINKELSFYERHKVEIIFTTILFMSMVAVIMLLLRNLHQKNQYEKVLKEGKQELQNSLEFIQTLINTIEIPIFYKDIHKRYLGCNNAFEKLLGVSKEQIVGKSVYDLAPEKYAAIYKDKDDELLESFHSYQTYETKIELASKEVRDVVLYKSIFYDSEGEKKGIVGAFLDITELKNTKLELQQTNHNLRHENSIRKAAEDELKQMNENLELLVQERTAELESANEELLQTLEHLKQTQEQLVLSEKMASLGGLVAGVAHEINTPVGLGLTGITHFINMSDELKKLYKQEALSETEFEEFLITTNELAQSILGSLTRAAELVKSFKQVAVDQSSEAKRLFNVSEYAHEVLLSLSNLTKKTKHTYTIGCDKDINVVGYPGAFSQILTNLIINSIMHAFSKDEKGRVEIELYINKASLHLRYRDNGRGVKEENLPKIFDPFFTTNRQDGGSGLGLNIIYNIVTNQLGGTIVCESKEGEGIEFFITFPVEAT